MSDGLLTPVQKDIAFLARCFLLRDSSALTVSELGRLHELADGYRRFPGEDDG